ncbi:hypothetical protein CLV28_3029 [Sediminihabitans luteus]|uniref:Acyl-CoA dehydrogenase/oxidase C-terminal domain-containing protein n=1 Tax=Sediminihabitans luteus TaxID=1138585 RepID=A0A2M9CC48_9CELL|nr:acyl-CoA dehydrogenase family protein [Sediminihabitans luteus]PJJ68613.1 hypothetical protein CLV28_3029 [Sediminihabitans luteus]GII99951.1 dehydrogenase [Sediminihabitans luteus]
MTDSARPPAWAGVDDDHAAASLLAHESISPEPGDAVALAARLGARAPLPGTGRTAELWGLLATLAATDVGAARMVEPHLDALAVLAQADDAGLDVDLDRVGADATSTWGVYAAEGPGVRLEATAADGAWRLTGTKPWCSLAATLSHALVTAWTPDGRRLFAVDLRTDAVRAADGPWHPRGLRQVVSAPVAFDDALAVPVGDAGWYLRRPGFAWGGIGVAACWWGGAVGVARTMFAAATAREPDQVALAHLGAVDTGLHAARTVLARAAAEVDAGTADGATARRARAVAADVVQDVLARSARSLGPGPLTTDEAHARRCADLELYVRQHHAERDAANHGRHLLEHGSAPW